jgi:peroxiredoxin
MAKILGAGTLAPPFTLPCTPDQKLSLDEFRGNPVVLVFYPADFSPVCGDQLTLYNEIYSEFQSYDAQILGISVDGAWCHRAFGHERRCQFPLLSDFEPKGEVARKYGVYREGDGFSGRALFVIDSEGVIQWSYLAPTGVNPGAEGIFKALDQLKEKLKANAA